jgi:hypothetical protein
MRTLFFTLMFLFSCGSKTEETVTPVGEREIARQAADNSLVDKSHACTGWKNAPNVQNMVVTRFKSGDYFISCVAEAMSASGPFLVSGSLFFAGDSVGVLDDRMFCANGIITYSLADNSATWNSLTVQCQ